MLFFLILTACVHNPPGVTTAVPTSKSERVQELTQLLDTDPSKFAEEVRKDTRSSRPGTVVSVGDFGQLRTLCTESVYADPAEMSFGVCDVVNACQLVVPDDRLDCSCLRCGRVFNGQMPLNGCERRSVTADISHSCDEPEENPDN